MNRKIRKYRAIEYIILCYAAVLMLLIGPLGIFDGSREVSGNENVQGKTAAVTQDARIQQVFIGDGGYLEKISIYAIQNLSRRVVSLTVSDELGETVFSRRVALDTYEAPGFFTIPVEFQTVQGRAYKATFRIFHVNGNSNSVPVHLCHFITGIGISLLCGPLI